jgi:hypothetical protein
MIKRRMAATENEEPQTAAASSQAPAEAQAQPAAEQTEFTAEARPNQAAG